MDTLLFLVGVVALLLVMDIAAWRWGVDSRKSATMSHTSDAATEESEWNRWQRALGSDR